MKGQAFVVKGTVYPFDVLFSVAQTNDEFLKTVRKHLPPTVLEEFEADNTMLTMRQGVLGRTIMPPTSQVVVRLKYHPNSAEYKAVLAHEIFHAAEFVFQKIGVPLISETSEVYAYLIGHITNKFYENYGN